MADAEPVGVLILPDNGWLQQPRFYSPPGITTGLRIQVAVWK